MDIGRESREMGRFELSHRMEPAHSESTTLFNIIERGGMRNIYDECDLSLQTLYRESCSATKLENEVINFGKE